MAWPSGTKASTTNVDAGSDKPRLARPDIKQNIDNVNSIIDTFDIAAPNNGDILTYNSTSGAWEPGAASSGGVQIGILNISSGEENVTGNEYRRTVSIDYDTFDFLTANGNYQITVAAGTYIFEPILQTDDDTQVDITLYDETGATTLGLVGIFTEIGTTGTTILRGYQAETFASSNNISFRQTSATPGDRNVTCRIRVTKL